MTIDAPSFIVVLTLAKRMNVEGKLFVHSGSRSRKLLTIFSVGLAFLVGSADAASNGNALSVHLLVPRDNKGNLVLPHGEAFEVGITNHSDQPIKIWEEECQPGNRSLTFRVKGRDGDTSIVKKRDVPKDVWIDELGYLPRSRTIPPRAGMVQKVDFSEFFWGDEAWQNVPEPNSGEKFQIQAVFEIAADDQAKTNGLWTGKIESAPLTVLVVNPKLSTPHQYLWHGCPRQALRVMKKDPSWIKKTDDMQCTPLHHAARFGPKEVVVWLVENGADVNATCYNQFTPLYFAASSDKLDILKYLISKGANVEGFSGAGTPLQAAAQSKYPEIVKALLDAGATYDINTAIYRLDQARVKALLAANPALARREGILHSACQSGEIGIVTLFVDNGADVNESWAMWKDSPLRVALPYPPIVKLLLEKGADPKIRLQIKGVPSGSTLLHQAAWKGELESARLLIEHGAEVDAIYVEQWFENPAKETIFTPLHSAALGGHAKVVELLLEHKADVKRRTTTGQDALQLAGSRIRLAEDQKTQQENQRYAEVVKILAARGLDIDIFTAIALGDFKKVSAMVKDKPEQIREIDSEGSFPLHRAVGMNQLAIAEKLLQAGADVNAVGRYGWTPLIEAAFWGRLEMVRLLLNRGAKADVTAEHGATALSEAERDLAHSPRKQEYEEVIRILQERKR